MKQLASFIFVVMLFVTFACGAPAASTRPPPTRPQPEPRPTLTPTLQPTATPTDAPPPLPPDAISWEDASAHIGEYGTVCGPVAGTSYRPDVNGSPTWLNVGRDFPSQSRFQIVIWGEDRASFPQPPESYYRGKRICATGSIESFRGVAEMEVSSPASIALQ